MEICWSSFWTKLKRLSNIMSRSLNNSALICLFSSPSESLLEVDWSWLKLNVGDRKEDDLEKLDKTMKDKSVKHTLWCRGTALGTIRNQAIVKLVATWMPRYHWQSNEISKLDCRQNKENYSSNQNDAVARRAVRSHW